MKIFILVLMLFMHVVDDYYLQGILASMKQKQWWIKNYPNNKYKYDYIVALITHAFSWAVMTTAPLIIFQLGNVFVYIGFFINWIIHAIVDDFKANKLKINLIQDQTIHILQIVGLWALSFI